MNWGHKIIVVYGVFVAGMSFLAFKASQQNTELVTEDYYGKELVYQKKIDAIKRTSLLSAVVNITYNNHEVAVVFPADFSLKTITGDVVLYCPSDATKDKQQAFTLTGGGVNMPVPPGNHGVQYVQVSWVADGLSYYAEQKINL